MVLNALLESRRDQTDKSGGKTQGPRNRVRRNEIESRKGKQGVENSRSTISNSH